MLNRTVLALGLVALGAHATAARCEIIYEPGNVGVMAEAQAGAPDLMAPQRQTKQRSALHFVDTANAYAGVFTPTALFADGSARTRLFFDLSTQLNTLSVIGQNTVATFHQPGLTSASATSYNFFNISFTLDSPYFYTVSADLASGTSEDHVNTLELGTGPEAIFSASGGAQGGHFLQSGVLSAGSYYFLGSALFSANPGADARQIAFDKTWVANLHMSPVPLPAGFGLLASALSLLGLGKSWIRSRAPLLKVRVAEALQASS